jgi:hypothetical protein
LAREGSGLSGKRFPGFSKEVLGMAKALSAKETTAQWCQIREGEPKAETAQLCQKEGITARERQAAWSVRQQ